MTYAPPDSNTDPVPTVDPPAGDSYSREVAKAMPHPRLTLR